MSVQSKKQRYSFVTCIAWDSNHSEFAQNNNNNNNRRLTGGEHEDNNEMIKMTKGKGRKGRGSRE